MPGTEQPGKDDLLNAGGQRTWGQTPHWTAPACPSSSPFPPILCPPNWTTWITACLRGFPVEGQPMGSTARKSEGERKEVWVLSLLVPTGVYLGCFCLSGKCYRCYDVAFSTHFLCLSFCLSPPIPYTHLILQVWDANSSFQLLSSRCCIDTTAFCFS